MIMNTDKAYIMGLLMGGGCFSSDRKMFYIKLPYNQWGDADKNPQRAGVIANDILRVVRPLMSVTYGLEVSYQVGREWKIVCTGDTKLLVEDLKSVNIDPTAELHKTADLSALIKTLVDKNMKKRFIAGVADTIGSMAASHRMFRDDVQIISFEISGFNYKFVCQLCNLMYELGCIPNQILWQHPNMHSGTDCYYRHWKKGNKLRVTLDAFSTFGSLAFKSKSEASRQNLLRESSGTYNAPAKCENNSLSVPGVVTVHAEEDNPNIPEKVRGGHYIHHKQICAVLECPHAPLKELDRLLGDAENYVSPFPVLHKDDAASVAKIIREDPILNNRTYTVYTLKVEDVAKAFRDGVQTFIFKNGNIGNRSDRKLGYPVNVILDALAFIVASKTGNLNGKRPRGAREEILANAVSEDPNFSVEVKVPDLLTPIVLTDGKVSAMVGPLNADVYKRLISYSDSCRYKMKVRKITEDDLR